MDFRGLMAGLCRPDWHGAVPGLSRIRALLKGLGNPEAGLPFIHVAGTNGKGSTAVMTASVLSAAGLRTGLFTSPYIQRFNERFRINGALIPDAAVLALIEEIGPAVRAMEAAGGEKPTEFEIYTAMALLYFAQARCDVAVMECGMGGRRDSSNAIPSPALAMITNIGLDHTETLGNTLEEIAYEKAGIIKPGSTVVLYPEKPEVEAVMAAEAERQGARLIRADEDVRLQERSLRGQRFHWGPYRDLSIPLLGDHQLKNAAVVLTGLECLREQGWPIGEWAIREGLAAARWPARMEVLREDPLFILDGGHNPQCVQTLMENVQTYCPDKRRIFLMGLMADKDYGQMCRLAAGMGDGFVTLQPENPRALPAEALAETLRPYGKPLACAGSVDEAIGLAESMAGEQGAVWAFGSLYMAADIRRHFGRS